ncbi:MAG: hypothetical protein AAGE61_21405 [Pseudomonadota bacterium]
MLRPLPPDPHDDSRSSSGDELVLTFLFGVLLAGVLGVLVLDFRALMGRSIDFDIPFLRTTDITAPIAPARQNDQIRRYSPQVRVDFGPNGRTNLPGVSGNPDVLLSGSMTFHHAGDGVASAVGLIDDGTHERFLAFLQTHRGEDAVRTLYLHSPGGSVRDAIDMARHIREARISTVIAQHGYCASSCPLVLSGGFERSIETPAALGVHQVFTSDTAIGTLQEGIANAQAVSAEAQMLLVDMGVDPRAWIEAMATPKDRLYLFTEQEIEDFGWTTSDR